MLNKWHKVWLLTILTLILAASEGRANPIIVVNSSYEGNGWYRYQVHLPVDPFWDSYAVGTFSITGFGTVEQMELPPLWTVSGSGNLTFTFTGANQSRPSDHVIRIKSPHAYCKRQSRGFGCTFSLYPKGWVRITFNLITNLVGFGLFDGLIPSATPVDEPSSTTHLRSSFSVIPDVRIEELVFADNVITGLKYSSIGQSATYQLEGSSDLINWNPITTFNSSDTTNTFYSSTLEGTGPFYRMLMTEMAGNLLASVETSTAPTSAPRETVVATVIIKDGKPYISFPSKQSASYTIELVDPEKGGAMKKISYQASESSSLVAVPSTWLGKRVLMQVREGMTATQ